MIFVANKASAAAAAISVVSLCISAVSMGYAAKLKADIDDSSSKSESSSVAAVEESSSALESTAGESSADDSSADAAEDEGIEQYVMYIGTNDKDTYKPEHTKEEALQIVDEICLKYFDGYTLQDATGSWKDEKDVITHEYTIVCYFDGADKETVYKAADDVIAALNQNTVLIESDDIQMEYYSSGN